MKVVIVAGGEPPSEELLLEELVHSSYLLCADSGANCLFKYGINPDYLMGDFDSIDKEVYEYFIEKQCNIETFKKDKDYTDTKLAVLKAIELGASEIVFLGCTGSRLDHTLGNLGFLKECLKLNIKATLKDAKNSIEISDKPLIINGMLGQYFSLLAYSECVKDLTIKGAKFELIDYDLKLGDPLTISNEFSNQNVEINFSSGEVLIIFSKD
jgi:thiamine pyrophosphokinase